MRCPFICRYACEPDYFRPSNLGDDHTQVFRVTMIRLGVQEDLPGTSTAFRLLDEHFHRDRLVERLMASMGDRFISHSSVVIRHCNKRLRCARPLRRAILLHQQQQHDHRRFRLDAVPHALGHVDPGSRLRLQGVVAQRQARLALEEVQDGGHRGRVFGKFLALAEAEDDHLEPVIVEQGAAQDALVGRLGFLRQIENMRVGSSLRSLLLLLSNQHDCRQMISIFGKDSTHCQNPAACFPIAKKVEGKTQGTEHALILDDPPRLQQVHRSLSLRLDRESFGLREDLATRQSSEAGCRGG